MSTVEFKLEPVLKWLPHLREKEEKNLRISIHRLLIFIVLDFIEESIRLNGGKMSKTFSSQIVKGIRLNQRKKKITFVCLQAIKKYMSPTLGGMTKFLY